MRVRLIANTAWFVACLALCGVPAWALAPLQAQVGRLQGGGTYIFHHTSGPAVAAIELWYRAPATGFGAEPVLQLSHVAAEAVAASVPITGRELSKTVAEAGGRLAITAYPDAVSVSVLVPSADAARVVRLMTSVYFAPVVTADGLRLAQHSVAEQSLRQSFNPDAILREALFGRLFADGPARYPAVSLKSTVDKIALDTVRAFATRAFRAENAVLVVTGSVDRTIIANAVAGRSGDAPAEAPFDSKPVADAAPAQQSFYEPGIGMAWVGPPITDEAAATTLDFVADYLCRPDTGSLALAVQKADPDASVFGQFITLHNPGVLVVQIATPPSSQLTTEQMRGLIERSIAKLQTPLGRAEFEAAKQTFIYHLLSDLQTPVELADNFGWYTIEGSAEYAPMMDGEQGKYFAAIDAMTPDSIAAVARTYLARPGAVVTLATASPAPAIPGAKTGT